MEFVFNIFPKSDYRPLQKLVSIPLPHPPLQVNLGGATKSAFKSDTNFSFVTEPVHRTQRFAGRQACTSEIFARSTHVSISFRVSAASGYIFCCLTTIFFVRMSYVCLDLDHLISNLFCGEN